MSLPLLLIVDGESIRPPSLVSALEGGAWSAQWIRSSDIQAFLAQNLIPDLVLVEPASSPNACFEAIQALRGRTPRLPLLVMAGSVGPAFVPPGTAAGIEILLEPGRLDSTLDAALRKYHPDAKLTARDIFGDLLMDLGQPALPPVDPFAMFEQTPAPAAASAAPVQAPLSAAEIFGSVLKEVEAQPAGVAEGRNPAPAKAEAAFWGGGVQSSAQPSAVEALGPSDFTLSGISGVNDPFEWAAPQPAPAPPPPPPKPDLPYSPEALEEYGNYFLLEKIAVGGMAELFKAQQRGVQGFQKIVAIKRILPHFSDNEDFVTMFIDEAKLAAQLTHPNIVQIFDLGKAGSSYYIAMEYVNGRDLRTLLRKVREYGMPFPEQVAAFVVMKVAAALDYAHRKRGFDDRELKLVHRDISPQNIILSTDGAVKLVDFGIAKAASKASHTMAGALKGKLLYMSPEQALGQSLDNRSDLYSLGLVLFELLTGERCFQADSELGVLEKVRLGRISDLGAMNPNVSREMASIVSRALQKGVDHRYPSARFMERDLHDYLLRLGNPITEHDVAEYMNALLRGSREHLESLVSSLFPPPANLTGSLFSSGSYRVGSGTHRVPGEVPASAAVPPQAADSEQETAVARLLPPVPDIIEPSRPRWLLPLILVLAVILVIMLIVAGRS